MRAARLVGPGRMEVERAEVPAPGPQQALVRMVRASVCGSDLSNVFGDRVSREFPCPHGYPGHEGVGEVIETRCPQARLGELVLVAPPPASAACFADFAVVPGSSLVPLPAAADPDRFVMAQQLGTVIFALKRFWPGPAAETAVVIGAGSAGIYFAHLLKRRGFPRLIVSDPDPRRLAVAERYGAEVVVRPDEASLVDTVMEQTGDRGADLVVEAVGRDATRAEALAAVAVRGRVGFFGLPERRGNAPFPFELLFRRQPTVETSALAQLEPRLASFRAAVDHIAAGEIDVGPMVGEPYSIEQLPEALDAARTHTGPALKVSLHFA